MAYTLIPDLAAEVAIPRAGTLSRVLHADDVVRLVLFAFDAGQELTEHTAAMPAVLQVISGRLGITVAGDCFELLPGAWLHLDAHEPHSLVAPEPSLLLLTTVRCGRSVDATAGAPAER